jgi:hypothetical protein
MNEQKSSADWYRSWWGIVIAILFLPLFAVWYVWVKTDWSKSVKWIVTVLVLIICLVAGSQNGANTETNGKQEKQESSNSELNNTYVFDVPSLFGKNIDQVREVLGTPTDGSLIEPTQQQLAGSSQWDNTFKKDSESLLVTFNAKDRSIIDFFISASSQNKADLLKKGNLKSSSSEYKLEYVKSLKNPSEITGVKIIPSK